MSSPTQAEKPAQEECRRLVMRFTEPTQGLDADDLFVVHFRVGLNVPVGALVNPLMMVVVKIVGQDVT